MSGPSSASPIVGLGLLGGSLGRAGAPARGVARTCTWRQRRAPSPGRPLARGAVDEAGDPSRRRARRGPGRARHAAFAMAERGATIAPRSRGADRGHRRGQREGRARGDPLRACCRRVSATWAPIRWPAATSAGSSRPRRSLRGRPLRGDARGDAGVLERVSASPPSGAGSGPGSCAATPAEVHDAEVAWMSHLPHMHWPSPSRDASPRAGRGTRGGGPGFRDFTRIAHSDPELWADILCAESARPWRRRSTSAARLARGAVACDRGRTTRGGGANRRGRGASRAGAKGTFCPRLGKRSGEPPESSEKIPAAGVGPDSGEVKPYEPGNHTCGNFAELFEKSVRPERQGGRGRARHGDLHRRTSTSRSTSDSSPRVSCPAWEFMDDDGTPDQDPRG